MKTMKYMVSKAMEITYHDPLATVVMFFGDPIDTNVAWEYATTIAIDPAVVIMDSDYTQMVMPNGASIMFTEISTEIWGLLTGMTISHAFHWHINNACLPAIRNHIRSTHKHLTPIGLYGANGAEIFVDY